MILKFMFIFLLLSYSCDIFADGNEDSLKSGEVNVYVYPFAFYTPETEFAFGAGGVINFRSSVDSLNKPSSITLSAYYSTRNQYLISLIPELYFDNGNYLLNLDFNFGKTLDEFYGIGNNSEEIDIAEYKYQAFGVNLSFQRQLFDEYYLGLIYDFGKEKMLDKKDNPYLKSGDIIGTDGGFNSYSPEITATSSPNNSIRIEDKSVFAFAYLISAGLSYEIGDNISLTGSIEFLGAKQSFTDVNRISTIGGTTTTTTISYDQTYNAFK